ncbi:MAG: HTTM domain-containing protein [Planctomycetota bacterium]
MKGIVLAARQWLSEVAAVWNQFWFHPTRPHTLALIRILSGAMLLYTHAVWSLDLLAFLGPQGWLSREAARAMNRSPWAWSFWWWVESPTLIWTLHLLALSIFFLLMIGCATRFTALLSFLLTLAYCHRLPGALFGLDQVNAMLSMYVMLGPSGAVYSWDAWWRRRRTPGATTVADAAPRLSTNLVIRLIQVHLCIVYLFGGISKLKGTMWWDGSAVWFALANQEYQTWDLLWLGQWPWLIALLTHLTVFWETFYPVLIWPRLTRPVMLIMAVAVHGGIALCLGMPTFGLAMLIANLSFVSPESVERCVSRVLTLPAQRARGIGKRA